ncbi:uncharacterized protein LOC141850866 isoform X2 [Brevipalpus obovatus]|uniref:uncharacterized protein LOC141850866 isoform X2 n=1 Tax=Brevipalpus obovatus TaxID=246614 RepID=UPI003D9DD83A
MMSLALSGAALIFSIFIPLITTQPTQQCLNCICQASSGCDLSKKCHNAGGGAYFCGPYQISWSYWSDGNKPGYRGGPHDFENCLNDKQCAEQAVIGYMSKWARDCNDDGIVNCADYAAIHKAGPHSCNAQWLYESSYWKTFQSTQCGQEVLSTSNSERTFTPPSRIISFTERDAVPREIPSPPDTTLGWSWPNYPPANRTSRPQLSPTDYNVEPIRRDFVSPPLNSPPRYDIQPPSDRSPNHEVFGVNPSNGGGSSYVVIASIDPTTRTSTQPGRPRPNAQPRSSDRTVSTQPTPDRAFDPNYDLISSSGNNIRIDISCLQCLCQASTGCNIDKQCNGEVCGPYLISWPYWADSGKPGSDFVSCALNAKCAESTVRNYMLRFGRDCNRDGRIDCNDFALIHKHGPNCGPGVPGNDKFWAEFGSCARPPIDERRLEPRRPANPVNQPTTPRDDSVIHWRSTNPPTGSPNEIPNVRPPDRVTDPISSIHGPDDRRPNEFTPFDSPRPAFPTNDSVYFNDARFFSPTQPPPPPPVSSPRFQPPPDDYSRSAFSENPELSQPNFPDHSSPSFTTPNPATENARGRPRNLQPPVRDDFDSGFDERPVTPRSPPYDYPSRARVSEIVPTQPPDEPSYITTPISPPSESLTSSALVRRESPGRSNSTMSEECLSCLCEATSKCDSNHPCYQSGSTQACGPYQISIPYWLAAGKPGYSGGSNDFITCVTNDDCAKKTVTAFLRYNQHDCNGDGTIDCIDFAAIHRLGRSGCENQAFFDSAYWNDFQSCYGFER